MEINLFPRGLAWTEDYGSLRRSIDQELAEDGKDEEHDLGEELRVGRRG